MEVDKRKTMIDKAREAIIKSSKETSIYIGCDSIRYKTKKKKDGKAVWKARYSTVIILHKDSNKGCQIFHNTEVLDDYGTDKGGNLRVRLMNEAGFSIYAAFELLDAIEDRHLEIHLDINPDPRHKSSIAIKEAVGWVRGSIGIDPKVKPDGWAATHGADHIARVNGS